MRYFQTKAIAVWMLLFLFWAACCYGADGEIHIVQINDPIGPAVADFILDAIDRANREAASCFIIELDTPGGLVDSMRNIVKGIYESKIPVIVFVSPSGARAASAGVMITMSADIAAMAPGTNIGAAHPVGIGGREADEVMSEKITNDLVAYVKSIAEKRGRNAEWAEKAVRESVSVTETEALKENIIDLIAADTDALIKALHGREIEGKGALELEGVERKIIKQDLRTRILKTISHPNITYILLLIGLAGLYFELSHPGAFFPGVIGGIALILAFFSFQTLPINYAGILLILLALILFILEMKVTSYGLLSIGGVISLFLGSIMLFKNTGPGMQLSWNIFIPSILLISAFFVTVAGLAFKAQMGRPRTGAGGLIGEIGIVKKEIAPEGKVFVHGELWNAVAGERIPVGTKVRVVKIENLVVEVERVPEA